MSDLCIAAFKPLWRWAVKPSSPNLIGMPFYTEASARSFLEHCIEDSPRCSVKFHLIRRRWFSCSGVEIVETHDGKREY